MYEEARNGLFLCVVRLLGTIYFAGAAAAVQADVDIELLRLRALITAVLRHVVVFLVFHHQRLEPRQT